MEDSPDLLKKTPTFNHLDIPEIYGKIILEDKRGDIAVIIRQTGPDSLSEEKYSN